MFGYALATWQRPSLNGGNPLIGSKSLLMISLTFAWCHPWNISMVFGRTMFVISSLATMPSSLTGEVMRILDGPFGIADVTIENLLCGTNNGVIEENIRRIQAITPAEVQRLAVKYLRREDLITAVVGAVDPFTKL